MTRLKPVTDSGEVVRRKEEKPNLFWPIGIVIALGLTFAAIFSFLPSLQQPASTSTGSGIGDAGAGAGNQPQQPVVPAVTPVGTEISTQTPVKMQETKVGDGGLKLEYVSTDRHFDPVKMKLNTVYTMPPPANSNTARTKAYLVIKPEDVSKLPPLKVGKTILRDFKISKVKYPENSAYGREGIKEHLRIEAYIEPDSMPFDIRVLSLACLPSNFTNVLYTDEYLNRQVSYNPADDTKFVYEYISVEADYLWIDINTP